MLYVHGTLDRAAHLRLDDSALAGLRGRSSTRLLPIWRGTVLVSRTESPDGRDGGEVSLVTLPVDTDAGDLETLFLGLVDDEAWFALNCHPLDDVAAAPIAAAAVDADGKAVSADWVDLRLVGAALPADDAALVAYARGMVYWSEHTRYCVRCGSALIPRQGGHVKQCGNTACAHQAFPRTDPAVIMLVTHGDGDQERCLLGRSPAWPDGVFSTLAGYVEPGETLEQAVRREVFEEAGIRTRDEIYVASQPWPFPRSIMLGFEARALDAHIICDTEELADARWFTRDEIGEFGNWGDERFALQLPRADSIARFLINRWVARESGGV